MYLKELIQKKQANPDYKPPYIPGQSKNRVARKTKHWDYRDVPSIYIPAHVKLYHDQSLFYEKAVTEMSRREMAALERKVEDNFASQDLTAEEQEKLEEEETMTEEEQALAFEEMQSLQPTRVMWIKKYLEQYKNNPTKREMVLEAIQESEDVTKMVLGDKFVPILD